MTSELHDAISEVGRGSIPDMVLSLSDDTAAHSLSLYVCPSRSRDGGRSLLSLLNDPAAIVLVRERDAHLAPSLRHFMHLYALTRSEARLACILAAGHSLQEAACTLGIAYETARSRLKSICLKTGTHRQAELVKVLVTEPSTIWNGD
jgi:DNA-binding CsgD family transcriptional regulator